MSEPDDPLADYEASRRRARRVGLLVSLGVAALVAGGWLWWRSTGLPPIDAETKREVSEAMDAIDTLPREHHAALAARAMVELEGERLPASMLQAYDDAQAVPPSMVSVVLMKPFADDEEARAAWSMACPAGTEAITDVAATGDIDKLFADCELGRWSLIDGTAARRISAGRLILAHATWGWLVDHHSETELERRILRVFVQG